MASFGIKNVHCIVCIVFFVLYVYFGIIALIYILDFSNHIDIYEKNKISIA